MSKIKDVTENFNEFISNGVAVVDFWANWCGPCRMLAPIIDDVADSLSDVSFGKVDVDQAQELARKYNVMSIPNVCIFKKRRTCRPSYRFVRRRGACRND